MEKIIINNFGPLKEVKLNLNSKLKFLIGAQASGKSTVWGYLFLQEDSGLYIRFFN